MSLLGGEQIVNEIVEVLRSRGTSDADCQLLEKALKSASIRPLRVIHECCVNGEVSTEALTEKYGYNQPPRAARDLRELGFDVKTKFGKTKDGRRMAIYSIDDFTSFSNRGSRRAFSKSERAALLEKQGAKCYYCSGTFQPNELQIDHRVPYEVAGNSLHETAGVDALILACASCNRRKSWSCEKCNNFAVKLNDSCQDCYWVNPDNYSHIAERKVVQLNISFDENHPLYGRLKGLSAEEIVDLLIRI